ncbi:MAG TPA: class I SAM-dependent methyltransferase [Candidatus Nitrosocosmicus sp.]|nr:class I SAM-dependent methyltransferase [Candidatus Nitrosocosmicus sp.]
MAHSMDMSILAKYDKLIVELGCGDGELIFRLSDKAENWNNFYLGIEIDPSQYRKCCLLLSESKCNLLFVNCPFEQVINELPDYAADEILCVLPHPKYIDRENEKFWQSLYKTLLYKIKKSGHLLLITEYTDELLSPVLYNDYLNWKVWIVKTFTGLGFCINKIIEGVPPDYTSKYIDLFRNDQERIKILTLFLTKNKN